MVFGEIDDPVAKSIIIVSQYRAANGSISILKRGGTFREDDILAELSIDRSDVTLVKAVNNQLGALEDYDLVEFTGKGWKWKS